MMLSVLMLAVFVLNQMAWAAEGTQTHKKHHHKGHHTAGPAAQSN